MDTAVYYVLGMFAIAIVVLAVWNEWVRPVMSKVQQTDRNRKLRSMSRGLNSAKALGDELIAYARARAEDSQYDPDRDLDSAARHVVTLAGHNSDAFSWAYARTQPTNQTGWGPLDSRTPYPSESDWRVMAIMNRAAEVWKEMQ